ncbi:hypothetical protein BC829DRAFT_116860 [Chytridium lagenaria]|nr:hypothetical protein BC829DRAFT_116860 [Chytridium lagenaria]
MEGKSWRQPTERPQSSQVNRGSRGNRSNGHGARGGSFGRGRGNGRGWTRTPESDSSSPSLHRSSPSHFNPKAFENIPLSAAKPPIIFVTSKRTACGTLKSKKTYSSISNHSCQTTLECYQRRFKQHCATFSKVSCARAWFLRKGVTPLQ